MVEIRVDDEITLRTIVRSDARPVFELFQANRDRFRWLPQIIAVKSVEDELRYIDEVSTINDGRQGFMIVVAGQIVGGVGHGPVEEDGTMNFGYWLAAEFEGRGMITRSSAVLLDRVFDANPSACVMIRAGAGNRRSRAVAERLGFTFEPDERNQMELEDGPVETVAYSMRNSDWPGSETVLRTYGRN